MLGVLGPSKYPKMMAHVLFVWGILAVVFWSLGGPSTVGDTNPTSPYTPKPQELWVLQLTLGHAGVLQSAVGLFGGVRGRCRVLHSSRPYMFRPCVRLIWGI